eukprot:CAMPEP_0198671562 /NCGR_PEP_ID=MMETSP1467-20131203/86720_1 /TAXON_ID=1462469 /ORGANISM="unid. sp., Strain CCMP2135" /LENGTH=33 /DNA_ID= /DNA_START= /DNA_END= /DNA_ORIENTATION=
MAQKMRKVVMFATGMPTTMAAKAGTSKTRPNTV